MSKRRVTRVHVLRSSPMAEPVLQDSLTYWEKQSATYNGVLGVSVVSLSSLVAVSRRWQAVTALAYILSSPSSSRTA
jgi:hypothetical protein